MGWICVGLGLIGAAVPLLPTVPFLLLALFCFERGSPELHQWLLDHKVLGPSLVQWKRHKVIRPRAKMVAVLCILASVGSIGFFRPWPVWTKGLLGVGALLVIVFICSQKNGVVENEE